VLFIPQLGAKDTAAEFGSGFNTKAACPADLASEVWQTRWVLGLFFSRQSFFFLQTIYHLPVFVEIRADIMVE
jgi:hypothetical protein